MTFVYGTFSVSFRISYMVYNFVIRVLKHPIYYFTVLFRYARIVIRYNFLEEMNLINQQTYVTCCKGTNDKGNSNSWNGSHRIGNTHKGSCKVWRYIDVIG